MTEPEMTPQDHHDLALIKWSAALAQECLRPGGPERAQAVDRLVWAISALNREAPVAAS